MRLKEKIKPYTPHFLLRINRYRMHTLDKIKQRREEKREAEFYRGNDVYCPLCGSHYRVFASFGLKKRKNARCHNCGSLERDRLLFKYLTECTSILEKNGENIKVLHFAPEKALFQIISGVERIDYVPCDINPKRFKYGGHIEIRHVDITNIPFDDNYFDFILCNHVLEHVIDDRLAMKELFRVMKKGGSGIFQVPINYELETTYEDFSITDPKEREKAFGQSDHVRWYGKDYKDRLSEAGFSVSVDDFVKRFSDDEIFRFGLSKLHLIYYCSKKN